MEAGEVLEVDKEVSDGVWRVLSVEVVVAR